MEAADTTAELTALPPGKTGNPNPNPRHRLLLHTRFIQKKNPANTVWIKLAALTQTERHFSVET